ncbi:MAG: pseudouridine synthase [Alicyclobacillaceae bacterium]|nr:pseudouridine synthase [Alicyclobacillaceae bacterium]
MPTQRLDRILTHLGLGSRREIKKWARAGRIEVDGRVVRDPSVHVDPAVQTIRVDGNPVPYRTFLYLMMNKPPGVVSATRDPIHRTVIDLLDDRYRKTGIFPVGRLDIDTEGLMLLTDDGKLAHALLSPRNHVPKTYLAEIEGEATEEDVQAFARGVTLEDGYTTLPAELRILSSGPVSRVEVVVVEGKFHQIKRMFAAVGKRVRHLQRISFGDLRLDPALPPGAYRELTEGEIALLRARANHSGIGPV